MKEQDLPTAREMFLRALERVDQAYASLGDAGDELRSDWRPLGSALNETQGRARSETFDLLGRAKDTLNDIKMQLNDAVESTQ